MQRYNTRIPQRRIPMGGNFQMTLNKYLKASVAALAISAGAAQAADVEVLHWWTSGGEAAALNVLKGDLEGQGIGWQDMPVAGGGGEAAMTVLRARVTAGNAPTAVQMLGFDITDWAKEGALANLNDVATAGGWDAVVPTALQKFAKYDGKWVAAPVNVHSTNWVWANKAVLDANGISAPRLGKTSSPRSRSSRPPVSHRSPMVDRHGRTRPFSTQS